MSKNFAKRTVHASESGKKLKRSETECVTAPPEMSSSEEDSSARGYRTLTVRLPARLHGRVAYMAGTTFGYTMSRIVREALEEKLASMSSG